MDAQQNNERFKLENVFNVKGKGKSPYAVPNNIYWPHQLL